MLRYYFNDSFLLSLTGGLITWVAPTYYFLLWNSDKYGCFNASYAVIRLFGLNWSNFKTRSIAISGTVGLNHYLTVLNFIFLTLSIIVDAS